MKFLPAFGLLFATVRLAAATPIPESIPLWPGAAPGSEKLTIVEKITERSTDPEKHNRIYTQIVTPSLTVCRPENPNGVSLIIAPGGAYQRIVIDKEGFDTAAWLNGLGITAFVLKYRLPVDGHENAEDVALQDAQRAMRLVRAHATEWGLDPKKIGFCGYSAGGHLAATVTFFSDPPVYQPVDAADELSARPDFSILGYAIGGPRPNAPTLEGPLKPIQIMVRKYKLENATSAPYPPTFLLHADDDPTVSPDNSTTIYLALKRAGTPAELHIFARGGHGFGVRNAKGPVARWPELCADWLKEIGVLPKPTAATAP